MSANFFYGNGNFNIIRDIEDRTFTLERYIDGEKHVFGSGNAVLDIRYAYKGPSTASYYAVVNSLFHLGAGNNVLSIKSSGNAMQGGEITAGAGVARVSIAAGKENEIALYEVKMNLGDGNNIVNVYGRVWDSEIMTGRGNDTISISSLWGASTLHVRDGNSRVTIGSLHTGSSILADSGNVSLFLGNAESGTAINLGHGNNTISFLPSTGLPPTPTTWSGTITTGSGNDIITADTLYGGTIDAGHGNNTVRVAYLENGAIKTGAGNDIVRVTQAEDSAIKLGDGNNSLEIWKGQETKITAGGGNDTVTIEKNGYLDECDLALGAGNDVLIFGRNAYIKDSTIDGGVGTDSFRLGLQQNNINLAQVVQGNTAIKSFEILDMTGGGINGLLVDAASLAKFSGRLADGAVTLVTGDARLLYTLATQDIMRINGDAADRVYFKDGEGWSQTGVVTYAGIRYNVWQQGTGTSTVLVQASMAVPMFTNTVTGCMTATDIGDAARTLFTTPLALAGSVSKVTHTLGKDNNWYGEEFTGKWSGNWINTQYALTTGWGDAIIDLSGCDVWGGSTFTFGAGDNTLYAGRLGLGNDIAGGVRNGAVTVNAAASLGTTEVIVKKDVSGALVNSTTFTSGAGFFDLTVHNANASGTGLVNSTLNIGAGGASVLIGANGDWIGLNDAWKFSAGPSGRGMDNSRLTFNGEFDAFIAGGTAMYGGSITVGAANLAANTLVLEGVTAGLLGVSNASRAAITLNRGNDTLSITTTATDNATVRWANITAGEGNNTITIQDKNLDAGNNGKPVHALAWSTLRAGNGDNTIKIGLDAGALSTWPIASNDDFPMGIVSSSITLGNGNNELGVYGGVRQSSITMGAGDNRISIDAFFALDASTVTLGNGNNHLSTTGMIWSSTLSVGAGDNVIDIGSAADGGCVVRAGNGNNTITFGSGIGGVAGMKGVSVYDAKTGKYVKYIATTLTAGNGNNTISLSGFSGLEGGAITMGNGNNVVELKGYQIDPGIPGLDLNKDLLADHQWGCGITGGYDDFYKLLYRSTITTGTGNDTITISGAHKGIASANLTDKGGNNEIKVEAIWTPDLKTAFGGESPGEMYAMDNAVLTCGGGNDTITLTAEGGWWANVAMNSSTLNVGNGDNYVHLTGLVRNGWDGPASASKIVFGSGNNTLIIDPSAPTKLGSEAYQSALYASTITTGGGNNSISVTGLFHGAQSAGLDGDTSPEGDAVPFTLASITTGAGNDTITVNGDGGYGLYGAQIKDGGGNNAIWVEGESGMVSGFYYKDAKDKLAGKLTLAQASISTGAGNDTITVTGRLGVGMDNAIITDTGGNNLITITGGNAFAAMTNKSSIVLNGAGNDMVIVDGDMESSTITIAGGNNSITVNGQMRASDPAPPVLPVGSKISTGSGVDTITVENASGFAMYNSQIKDTGGNNAITITSDDDGIKGGMDDGADKRVAIATGAGHDVIIVKATGAGSAGLDNARIKDAGGNNIIEVFGKSYGMRGDETAIISKQPSATSKDATSSITTGAGNDIIQVKSEGTAMYYAAIADSGGNNQISLEGKTAMDTSWLTLASTAANVNFIDITGLAGAGAAHLITGSTILCGAGADILTIRQGTGATGAAVHNSRIDLGAGNDLLCLNGKVSGSSIDMGAGNDMVYLSGASVFESGSALKGGLGMDVLNLDGWTNGSSDIVFSDLTSGGSTITGFEIIDLTGGNQNTLILTATDVKDMAMDTAITFKVGTQNITGKALRVIGDADDMLTLTLGEWGGSSIGTTTYSGTDYKVFYHSTNNNYLLVQSNLL